MSTKSEATRVTFYSMLRGLRRFCQMNVARQRYSTNANISFLPLSRSVPVDIPASLQVNLSPKEDELCSLLDECKHQLARKGDEIECRIAGGWVRDKLLGAQSNDIDIALSNMMGVAFAEHFVDFVKSKNIPVKTVSTIARNPEQSKHLETARTTILDIELDFVNLRSEQYAENSRIPTDIKLGTPLEDALRRDITINTLFYNVHSRSVEDFTGKGIDDLRNGFLRTPLPPKETFRDDPLRVIRCVRFASRYGFRLDPEIERAAKDQDIQFAITTKISRERVGEEIDKMMKGRDPLQSIRIINDLELYDALFMVPTIADRLSERPAPATMSLAAATILDGLMSNPSCLGLSTVHPLLLSQLDVDKTLRPRLFLAAALTPFRGRTFRAKKSIPATEAVIREALKLGLQNHYIDGVPALFAAADELWSLALREYAQSESRARIGLLLKNKFVHNANSGSHWTSSLLFSVVQELVPLWDPHEDKFDAEKAQAIIDVYNNFTTRVVELKLPQSIDEKPLLNGHDIVATLSASKPGQWTGDVLAKVVEWQLDHPDASKEACMTWLKEEFTAGRIRIDEPPKRGKAKGSSNADGGGAPAKRVKTDS